jgi:hypothetical protein
MQNHPHRKRVDKEDKWLVITPKHSNWVAAGHPVAVLKKEGMGMVDRKHQVSQENQDRRVGGNR